MNKRVSCIPFTGLSVLAFFVAFLSLNLLGHTEELLIKKWNHKAEIRNRLHGETNVNMTEDGEVSTTTIFSNGRKLHKYEFTATVFVHIKDLYRGTLCFKQSATVPAAGFGTTVRRRVAVTKELPEALVAKVDLVEVQYNACRVGYCDSNIFITSCAYPYRRISERPRLSWGFKCPRGPC